MWRVPCKNPNYWVEIVADRRHYWRQFRLALILILISASALVALTVAQERGLADNNTLDIGRLAAIAILALSVVRAAIGLIRLGQPARTEVHTLFQSRLHLGTQRRETAV